MGGFEGHGDFDSDDPWERYAAHQAAKGRSYVTAEQADVLRKQIKESAVSPQEPAQGSGGVVGHVEASETPRGSGDTRERQE